MPARFPGGRWLSTPAAGNQLLHGAATASASLWLRLDAVRASTNTCNLFLKQWAQSFQLVRPSTYSNRVRLEWVGAAGFGYADVTLTVGTWYHLALAWEGGLQRYYAAGVLVGTGAVAGALASNPQGRYIYVGDQGGHTDVDVTISEPSLWQGYALSAQDVLDLRNRVKAPTDIAPASLVWSVSLTGPDGVPCAAGDAGLANLGTAAGQNLVLASAPVPFYDGDPPPYVPPVPAVGPSPPAPAPGRVLLDTVDFPLQLEGPAMDNARVTTGLTPLCVGSAELFVLRPRLDGLPWDLTGGSATLLLTDPAGTEHSLPATLVGGQAQAGWVTADPPGTWLRAWDATDLAGKRQVSRPIAFTVEDSPS